MPTGDTRLSRQSDDKYYIPQALSYVIIILSASSPEDKCVVNHRYTITGRSHGLCARSTLHDLFGSARGRLNPARAGFSVNQGALDQALIVWTPTSAVRVPPSVPDHA